MTGISHASDRAYIRYGLKLDRHDLGAIAAGIRRNEGTLIARLDDGKSAWDIEVKGKTCKIVMSADLYTVCTFLPSSYEAPIDRAEKGRERAAVFYKAGKKCFGTRRRAFA